MSSKAKKTETVLTHQQMIDALNSANRAYIARNKEDAKLNSKTGLQGDVSTAMGFVKDFTDVHLSQIAEMGLNDSVINCLSNASNVKQTKRIMQSLLFTLSGNGVYLQASAKAWFLGYMGIIASGAKTVDGVKFCITGKGNEHTSDAVRSTEKARKILNAFGAVSLASVDTQYSVGFGKGGISDALKCATKDSKRSVPTPKADSPIIARLDEIVRKATDGYIELIAAQSASSSKRK